MEGQSVCDMFLIIRFDIVFQTRNFQGSQKMNRWLKRSRSWRRGFRMSQDSWDQLRSLPRKVSISDRTCAVCHMLDVMVSARGGKIFPLPLGCEWKHKRCVFPGWPINVWLMCCQCCVTWICWDTDQLVKGAGRSFTLMLTCVKLNKNCHWWYNRRWKCCPHDWMHWCTCRTYC